MQPGYPGSGQDPYNQQPPSDPFGAPGYGQYPAQPDPYNPTPAPGTPYQDPYNPAGYPPQQPQQPISGQPYDPYSPGGQYQQSGYDPNYPAQAYQPPVVYPGAAGYTVPGAPPVTGQNNTLGLLSMIFGIVSIPLAFCCLYLGIPLGIAALILGVLGMNKVKMGQASNRGMALAGVICGCVGVGLGVLWLILVFGLNIGSGASYY